MSKTTPWFDPIAFAYAKDFDEVEIARAEFETQRLAIVDRLREVAKAAARRAGIKESQEPERDDGWDSCFFNGLWTKIRVETGKKPERQSGICVGVDHDPFFLEHGGGRFGFGAYAWFAMSNKRYDKLEAAITTAATANGCVADYAAPDVTAYVRCAWLRPGDETFSLEAFEGHTQRAIEVFPKIDEAIATAYKASKAA
jgi:hypothetical protein